MRASNEASSAPPETPEHKGAAFHPDGNTPLKVAAENGHDKIVGALCSAKVDANQADKYGATPDRESTNVAAACNIVDDDSDLKMLPDYVEIWGDKSLWCSICQLQATLANMKQHLNGERHAKACRQLENEHKLYPDIKPGVDVGQDKKEKLVDERDLRILPDYVECVEKKFLCCGLCDVKCTASLSPIIQHLCGEKHAKACRKDGWPELIYVEQTGRLQELVSGRTVRRSKDASLWSLRYKPTRLSERPADANHERCFGEVASQQHKVEARVDPNDLDKQAGDGPRSSRQSATKGSRRQHSHRANSRSSRNAPHTSVPQQRNSSGHASNLQPSEIDGILHDLDSLTLPQLCSRAHCVLEAFPVEVRLFLTRSAGPASLLWFRGHMCRRGVACKTRERCTFAHDEKELLVCDPAGHLRAAALYMKALHDEHAVTMGREGQSAPRDEAQIAPREGEVLEAKRPVDEPPSGWSATNFLLPISVKQSITVIIVEDDCNDYFWGRSGDCEGWVQTSVVR